MADQVTSVQQVAVESWAVETDLLHVVPAAEWNHCFNCQIQGDAKAWEWSLEISVLGKESVPETRSRQCYSFPTHWEWVELRCVRGWNVKVSEYWNNLLRYMNKHDHFSNSPAPPNLMIPNLHLLFCNSNVRWIQWKIKCPKKVQQAGRYSCDGNTVITWNSPHP